MIIAPRPDWSAADLVTPIVGEAEPPAALESLALAEWWTRAVAAAPYAATLRFADGATSPATTRRATQAVGPGCRWAKWTTTRYGYGNGPTQAATSVSTAEGGIAVYSQAKPHAIGTAALSPIVQQGGEFDGLDGGDEQVATNGAASMVRVPEALAPALVEVEWQYGGALSLYVPAAGQTDDLETL